jgi:cyclophilin family peptidyl-prolyl cis-trans isomerase
MKASFFLIIILAAVVAAGGVYLFRPEPEVEKVDQEVVMEEPEPIDNTEPWPPRPDGFADIEPIDRVVRITLKTSMGDIDISLDGPRAPYTVGNFVNLAKNNFYDGTTFHRVIEGFMIQGGDPLSKDQSKRGQHGMGGPDYKFNDEINPRKIVQGVLAMANAGPGTNGSQFFIVTAPEVPHLDGMHTAFGVVEKGMDIVFAISKVETDERDNPIEPIIVEDVIVGDPGLLQGLELVEE